MHVLTVTSLLNMTTEHEEKLKIKKKKKGRSSKVISFDEEIIPKHIAQEILSQADRETANNEEDTQQNEPHFKSKKTRKKRKKREKREQTEPRVESETPTNLNDGELDEHSLKKKKKKQKLQTEEEGNKPKKKRKKTEVQQPQAEDSSNPENKKKPESIREQKRKKYAKLLEEKKMKAELAMQQKSLNYLSKWKHSRGEWKFEKLRQIWLQHNMYDEAKVPQEFWETLVEYLSNSQGKVRDVILKDAVKIIEEERSEDAENIVKVERARDIIQNLQE